MIKDNLKKSIIEALSLAGKEKQWTYSDPLEFSLFCSEKEQFGHYSTNLALILAKEIQQDSREIARIIKEKIKLDFLEKIEIAGPGFLNFYLSADYLRDQIKEILDKEEAYSQLATKPEKILIEFISANPTGQIHVGNGRGAFFGDVLGNILKKAGYQTEKEYYINDARVSRQIKELGKTALGQSEAYKNKYLDEKLDSLKEDLKEIKDTDQAGFLLAQAIQKDIHKFVEKDLNIKFDNWFSEEEQLYQTGQIDKLLGWLKEKKLVYEKDKAWWLKTSDFGDDQDWVVVREDGLPSYLLADIAYHQNKFERGFNRVIDIWGADHQGHVKKMMAVQRILNYQGDFNILITQMVRLKSAKKLSKRKGNIITLNQLVEEVAVDVARFIYLMKSLDCQMEFDLELAKEQSQKNPVYYIQYAFARINSIFSKAENQLSDKNLNLIKEKVELNLISQLLKWPEIIEETASDYQVQRVPHYAKELAASFHSFYKECQVLSADLNLRQARLALVKATAIILKDILLVLGVSAPEKM